MRTFPSKLRPYHRHWPNQSRLEDAKIGRLLKMRTHSDALHGHMRKKLCCVKVGFMYPKIMPLIMRGISLDIRLRFYAPKFGAKKKDAKRSKTSRSSSFNTESEDASINLNVDAGDDDGDEVQELQRQIGRDKAKGSKKKGAGSSRSSSSMNDEALARLMVSELATHNKRAIEIKKEERLAFLEI
ncbi:hypothetical protein Tco_0751236 [Tanacetum coccineum]|uniref:Uncharacterized protein n=1 Tax=Tanacetum coccineum TaxID=301880 RepID=A0ABQ4Z4H0_9ASTR